MAGKNRKNRVASVLLPLRITPSLNQHLEELAQDGLLGKNKADVATFVLREWVWHNLEKVRVQSQQRKVSQ